MVRREDMVTCRCRHTKACVHYIEGFCRHMGLVLFWIKLTWQALFSGFGTLLAISFFYN